MSDPESKILITEQKCVHKLRCNNMHCQRQHPAGWKRPPTCRFGKDCTYPRCKGSGGGAVAFNSRSHQRVPPTKPALQTDADILERVMGLGEFGIVSKIMVDNTLDQLTMVRHIHSASKMLKNILSTFDSLHLNPESLEKSINEAFSYFNRVENLANVFQEIKTAILNSEHSVEIRKKAISMLLEKIQLPQGVDEILSLDPLAQAREDLDGIPNPKFLDHLANACGLRDNKGFCEMRSSHEKLAEFSPFRNNSFLGILSVYEATKQANELLEAQRLNELKDRVAEEARAKLLQECLKKGNLNLKIAFRILQNPSEFLIFLQSLSKPDCETLVSVFGPFMSYLAQGCDKNECQITSDFFSTRFMSFTKSRKLDQKTAVFKERFFKIVNTEIFDKLIQILSVNTSSLHRSKNGSSGTPIPVQDILKYILKELVDIYEDKVPRDEREGFYMGLVKELLPLAFLISLSPDNSNMLAGRWKKGEIDKRTNQPVNHYIKMQNRSEKKSILYWLLMNLTQNRRRNQSSCDTFDKLPSEYTREFEIVKPDGFSTEKKRVFSPDLLFQAIREVVEQNFLKASEFPVKVQNMRDELLGTLFCVEDDTISVSPECPNELLLGIYFSLGCNEKDQHTRQFSDVKAVMHMDSDIILNVVQMCQSFNTENQMESVLSIIQLLGFENDRTLVRPLITLLTLISENTSEDILRKAYDIMSFAMTLIEIHNCNDGYFMSLVDALVVVLLTEKFPNVRQFDIVNALYEAKSDPAKVLYVNSKWVQSFVDTLTDSDSRKARLTDFISRGKSSNPNNFEEMKSIVSSLRPILCLHDLVGESFHEKFKRIFPFLFDETSLVMLSTTDIEFEIESSKFSHSRDYSVLMLNKINDLFEKEITAFIASQNCRIQSDLKARMKEISQIEVIVDRFIAFGLTKHASAIANLLNSLFSTLALPHHLNAETFFSGFPKTKGLSQYESAKLVCDYVLSVIGIVKPVEPAKPVEAVEKKKKSKESKAELKAEPEANYKASLAEFNLAMDKFKIFENIVFRAISAIYRVDIPKEEGATFKKAPTIQLSGLKDILLKSTTLVDLFGRCLPYWKSPLVRELILPILDHKFKCGDRCVFSLYREIQSFSVSFESSESSQYKDMFSFLTNAEAVLQKTDSYNMSDDDMIAQMNESLCSDFWNESEIEVEISSQDIQRNRKHLLRRRPEHDDESEISFGGGPAPDPDPEVVEYDSDPAVVAFDVGQLRSLLANDSKDDAIAYMESLPSRDEIEEGILNMLKEEDSICQSVLEAVNGVY